MAKGRCVGLLLGLLLLCQLAVALSTRQPQDSQQSGAVERKKKKKHPYTSPAGLFIQERASKQLPGPGQHFSFGALKPWEDITAMLGDNPDRKLLLVVRHGQAISNYLGDTLGPDEWYAVEGTCQYDDGKGTIYNIFDADLTGLGQDQAKSLNSMLVGGGWYDKTTGGRPVRFVISPLTRCLHTATIALADIKPNATNVEEFVRETLGQDTCDARRSVSDPNFSSDGAPESPCSFDKGLATTYPQYKYRVYDARDGANRGLGLLGDSDHLWTKESRERQKHQVKRAKKFLDILFDRAPEQVIIVVTHSGFTRSLLLAVQREPYRPQNAEMVPVIVDKTRHKTSGVADADTEDDSWIEEALRGYEDMDLGVGGIENSQGERVGVRQQQQTGPFVSRMKQLVRELTTGWSCRQQKVAAE
jgi:broad specificity phosphatase PhoE